jgi:PAS domain S-box-containing protein
MPTSPDAFLTPDRMESALDAAGIGVWEMDLPNKRFSCSARCKQLFGLPHDWAVALEDILGAAHPDDRAVVEGHLHEALNPASDGRFAVEHRVMLPNGQARWVRSTGMALFDEARSQAVRFQGITKEIADDQVRTRAREHYLKDFEFLAEAMPGILWMAQPDGAVSYINQRWMQYTGQTQQQGLNWGWEDVVCPEDMPRCLAQWTHSLRTGEPYEVEYRFRRHDGVYRWFLGRALPHRNAAGALLKWLGVSTDIHEQKQLELKLRQREEELEQAYRGLEAQVSLRTQALEAQVRQLEAEIRRVEPPR